MKKFSRELMDIGVDKASKKLGLSRMKKNLVKLYLRSPSKIQAAIAKRGVKNAMNKARHEILETLKA